MFSKKNTSYMHVCIHVALHYFWCVWQEENTNLRIKYEQALAQRESADIEKERFKELYENEMKWRVKLWEQLQDATEKSSSLKSKLT